MPSIGRGVESISRALDLLEALSREREVPLAELARATCLQPSTVHRQLATLVARGYVQQNAQTSSYMLGYRVLKLARGVESRNAHLRSVARPFMVRIRKVCGETTNLTVLDGADIVYIEQLSGSLAVRMFTELGLRVPAHATASGKAMMALMDTERIAELVGPEPFEQFTDSTVASMPELLVELEGVRKSGFAVDHEEFEDGVSCVAAPIRDSDDEIIAALSVSGPSSRLGNKDDLDALGELVSISAREASEELGFVEAVAL